MGIHRRRIPEFQFSKDMRMAPDHLGADGIYYLLEIEMATLLSQARLKGDLEQEITQLIALRIR